MSHQSTVNNFYAGCSESSKVKDTPTRHHHLVHHSRHHDNRQQTHGRKHHVLSSSSSSSSSQTQQGLFVLSHNTSSLLSFFRTGLPQKYQTSKLNKTINHNYFAHNDSFKNDVFQEGYVDFGSHDACSVSFIYDATK